AFREGRFSASRSSAGPFSRLPQDGPCTPGGRLPKTQAARAAAHGGGVLRTPRQKVASGRLRPRVSGLLVEGTVGPHLAGIVRLGAADEPPPVHGAPLQQ